MNEWMNEPSVCWVVGHWLCYIELLCLHLPFRLLQIIGLPTSCLLIKTCRSSPLLLPVMQPLHNRPQVIIGPWLTINVTGIWFICFLLLFIALILILFSPPFLCKLKYSNLILGVVGEKFKLTQSIKNFVSFELNILVYKYIRTNFVRIPCNDDQLQRGGETTCPWMWTKQKLRNPGYSIASY